MSRSSMFAGLVGVLLTLLLCGVPVACGVRAFFVVQHEKDERGQARESYEAAPVPEVVLGSPSAPPPPLVLPAYPAGELADAGTWPRACSLLTDEDIRAILPQADMFQRAGTAETLRFLLEEQLPGGLVTGKRAWVIGVPEQQCQTNFWLPHKSLNGEKERIAYLTVEVDVAGDPAVARRFSGPYGEKLPESDFARSRGAVGCYGLVGGSFLRCTKGPLTLSVSGSLNTHLGTVERVRMPAVATDAYDKERPYYGVVVPAVMTRLLAKIP